MERIDIITLNKDNIEKTDIVCVRGKKNEIGIEYKKKWLKERFKEGLQFKEFIVDGRSWGFIEYIPAEYSWKPIIAPNFIVIHCFWIIGRHKSKGNSKYLLDACFSDAKNKDGIVVITSNKPFTTKKNIFIKNGFEICDKAEPYFELLVKKFNPNAPTPKFNDSVKKMEIEDKNGLVIFYSHQCPYFELHIEKMLQISKEYNIPAKKILIDNKEIAQNFPSAFGTCSMFYNGKFLTHELWRENTLREFLALKYNTL